ncbi:MAG: helix-turn-helix domain-containing protein [Halorhabdus sp.]
MSLKEQIRSEPSIDGVLETMFDLTHSERQTYRTVVERDEPVTAVDVAEEVGCARTSAYRYIDTLENKGLFRRVTPDYDGTGRSAYVANPPTFVADRMEHEVEDIYTRCRRAIADCRPDFDDA